MTHLMKCIGPTFSSTQLKQLKEQYAFSPDVDELAARFSLAGSPTRLKMLALFHQTKELCVCDLAEILSVTVSNVSQHLSKFKAYGLVKSRRDGNTIYYALSDSDFTRRLRKAFLRDLEV